MDLLAAGVTLPLVNDGWDHGDPRFMPEPGWSSLFNGRNQDEANYGARDGRARRVSGDTRKRKMSEGQAKSSAILPSSTPVRVKMAPGSTVTSQTSPFGGGAGSTLFSSCGLAVSW